VPGDAEALLEAECVSDGAVVPIEAVDARDWAMGRLRGGRLVDSDMNVGEWNCRRYLAASESW
jgi:hypothetical protein